MGRPTIAGSEVTSRAAKAYVPPSEPDVTATLTSARCSQKRGNAFGSTKCTVVPDRRSRFGPGDSFGSSPGGAYCRASDVQYSAF